MDLRFVERIADALLYEGYLLYPYRPSAIKNQRRFNFGVVFPQSYGLSHDEPFFSQTECLAVSDWRMAFDVRVRFLHLTAREGRQEAVAREVTVPALRADLLVEPLQVSFAFPETLSSGGLRNTWERARRGRQEPIDGNIEISGRQVTEGIFKITTRVLNMTQLADAQDVGRDEALKRSLVSTHTILNVRGGEFISLLDPPESLRDAAGSCLNIGTYPVLVGPEGTRDTMLASPIILYDYPQIAPASAGDLFDGTEIDEMLALRILTLTDEEKREMRDGDERARRILERTESMSAEQLLKLHGVARSLRPIEGDA
jgi:hypothetical protein